MAEYAQRMESFPFDSSPDVDYDEDGYPIYDRAVGAEAMRRTFAKYFSDGVFPNPAEEMEVSAGDSGLTVKVAPGTCIIKGSMGTLLDEVVLTLDTEVQGNTVYGIMAAFDNNEDRRSVYLRVAKGVPGSNMPPDPDRSTPNIYEYRIADVSLATGATSVSAANITNNKGTSVWPYAAPFEEIDVEAVVRDAKAAAQEAYESFVEYLDENMDFIKDAIDGTTAGNLQNQIDAVKEELENFDLSGSVDNDTIFYEAPPLQQDKKLIGKPKVDGETVHRDAENVLSASPRSDGSFGDYSFIMTTAVMKAMVDGGTGLSIGQTTHNMAVQAPSSNFNTQKNPTNVNTFLMPNGGAVMPYDMNANGLGYSNDWACVSVSNAQGVATAYHDSAVLPDASVGGQFNCYANSDLVVFGIKADSFPVQFIMASTTSGSDMYNGHCRCRLNASLVTITAQGVATFTTSGSTLNFDQGDGRTNIGTTGITMNELGGATKVFACLNSSGKNMAAAAFNVGANGSVGVTNRLTNAWINGNAYTGYAEVGANRTVYTGGNGNTGFIVGYDGTIQYTNVTKPSVYYVQKEGEFTNWNGTKLVTSKVKPSNEADEQTSVDFNPLILFDMGMSVVSSAAMALTFEVPSTDVVLAVNSGSDTRGMFVGANNIGCYGNKVAQTIANAGNITKDKVCRNKYRTFKEENEYTIAFDNGTATVLYVMTVSYGG